MLHRDWAGVRRRLPGLLISSASLPPRGGCVSSRHGCAWPEWIDRSPLAPLVGQRSMGAEPSPRPRCLANTTTRHDFVAVIAASGATCHGQDRAPARQRRPVALALLKTSWRHGGMAAWADAPPGLGRSAAPMTRAADQQRQPPSRGGCVSSRHGCAWPEWIYRSPLAPLVGQRSMGAEPSPRPRCPANTTTRHDCIAGDDPAPWLPRNWSTAWSQRRARRALAKPARWAATANPPAPTPSFT